MKLPHEGTYVRLKPSPAHGVGVFAIKDIPSGKIVFPGADEEYFVVDAKKVSELHGEVRKLYEDFCVIEGDKYYCPHQFWQMNMSWYLNDSEEPNCRYDENLEDFITIREIKAGEELTANYLEYSDR